MTHDFQGRFPRHRSDFTDLRRCITEFVLPGFVPQRPPLTPQSRIATIGSCFSRHIAENLAGRGMTVAKLEMAELATTPELVSRMLQANPPTGADCLIVTLGIGDETFQRLVNEIWGILRLAALAEVKHTIVTVSPATLNRSAMPSAVVADCISKSKLRAAVDEGLRQWNAPAGSPEALRTVSYWPSFEIVRWLGAHLPRSVYGADDDICRHVDMDLVGVVMDLWAQHWVAA